MFLIMAGIAWIQIDSMRGQEIESVFDLTFFPVPGVLGPGLVGRRVLTRSDNDSICASRRIRTYA